MPYNNIPKFGYPFNEEAKIETSMTLSKNHSNLVYIMIDSTTGFDVTSLLQSDNNLANNFTGFTNFCNLISTNHATNASIPNLFGGFDHNPFKKNDPNSNTHGMTFRQYMKKSINNLVSAFGEKEWDITLVNPQYFHYNKEKGYWSSNWQWIENEFKKYNLNCLTANDLSKFMLTKYPRLYKERKFINNLYALDTHHNDVLAMDYLKEIPIKNTENSKVIIFMTESNHRPYIIDENGQAIEPKTDANAAYDSCRFLMKQINDFITNLKENDIYDNTMLCIVSDHGAMHGSLPIEDEKYNFSGISYQEIKKMESFFNDGKFSHFITHFPTMLIKPYNMKHKIIYETETLHCNTDALSYIEEHNPDVNFTQLKKTQDPRYCSPNEIKKREYPLVSYGADSLWIDEQIYYVQTKKRQFGHDSLLVRKNIFFINNYSINATNPYTKINEQEFCNPDNRDDWISLTVHMIQKYNIKNNLLPEITDFYEELDKELKNIDREQQPLANNLNEENVNLINISKMSFDEKKNNIMKSKVQNCSA